MKPLRYHSRDYIAYLIVFLYLGVAFVFRVVGI